MFGVVLGTAAVGLIALALYLGRERLGLSGLGMALLRALAMGALLLLFINPTRAARVAGGSPVVLLDASLSMSVTAGGWKRALDSARTLAGRDGLLLRFGATVVPFDTLEPLDGRSMLREPLRAALATSGQVRVVTDGEIEDVGAIDPDVLNRVTLVLLPRDTVLDVALLDVRVPARVQRGDSIPVSLTIAQWGDGSSGAGRVQVFAGDRELEAWPLVLPPGMGVARRSVSLRAGLLPVGTHALRFALDVPGDSIRGDDERYAVVTVSTQPAVVVLVDPPGWEGRFLVSELTELARAPVTGYARVREEAWLDMLALDSVSPDVVRRNAGGAGALFAVGSRAVSERLVPGKPSWLWPMAAERAEGGAAGDWYLDGEVPPSPLAGQLGRIRWDSLAPLPAISLSPNRAEWVGLTARRTRRGPPLALFLGTDSSGIRTLATMGDGLWRWRFRGGAAREAYRTLIAAGVDWLLRSDAFDPSAPLSASRVVARGEPVVFRWRGGGDAPPESLSVRFTTDTSPDTTRAQLRFDRNGNAPQSLSPGVYRWVMEGSPGVKGVSVVESYSDEYHPRPVLQAGVAGAAGTTLVERAARERWWWFAVVVIALAGEWAWRQRRGLP